MVNCYDCRCFVPGGRYVSRWTRKAKEALEILWTVGWDSRHRMPYCRHYDKFLHEMPDVDNNKTWVEDVWKVGCDWAHYTEHNSNPGHRSGNVFPTLARSGHNQAADRRKDPHGILSTNHGRKVI